MKRLIVALLITVLAAGICGCFLLEPSSTSKKLTTYYDDLPSAAGARFYIRDRENNDADEDEEGGTKYLIEELPQDQIEELCEAMDEIELIWHMGHTDYFYSDWYCIELELEDGTYLTYDGTCLELNKKAFDDEAKNEKDNVIHRSYLEDANKEFWDKMEQFFPAVAENKEHLGYGW